MSAKPTPGPWRAKRLVGDQEPGCVVLWPDKGGAHHRRLDYKGHFTAADAALIAAAPDLQSCVQELQESAAYWSEYDVPPGIVDRLNAALAKASELPE